MIGSISDKQIESKILLVYMDFFSFFLFRVLLCFKALVMIGFTVFAQYVEAGKGFHKP